MFYSRILSLILLLKVVSYFGTRPVAVSLVHVSKKFLVFVECEVLSYFTVVNTHTWKCRNEKEFGGRRTLRYTDVPSTGTSDGSSYPPHTVVTPVRHGVGSVTNTSESLEVELGSSEDCGWSLKSIRSGSKGLKLVSVLVHLSRVTTDHFCLTSLPLLLYLLKNSQLSLRGNGKQGEEGTFYTF